MLYYRILLITQLSLMAMVIGMIFFSILNRVIIKMMPLYIDYKIDPDKMDALILRISVWLLLICLIIGLGLFH